MSERPPIPESVKREVRRRCGFGCIFCGAPIYHYDHMIDYREVQGHDSSNITLLCPTHHHEKTYGGQLPRESVVEQNKKSYNLQDDFTTTRQLYFSGDRSRMVIGGSGFFATFQPPYMQFDAVIINERKLLSFLSEDGRLLINFEGHDREGNCVLQIIRSQLRHTTGKWDVEYVAGNLIIREGPRDIIMDIMFHPPDGIEIKRAYFTYEDARIEITPGAIIGPHNNMVIGGVAVNVRSGIIVGRNRQAYGPAAWSFGC